MATSLLVAIPGPVGAVSAAEINAAAIIGPRHVQSGQCLDGSLSQGVRLHACDGGTYQRWIISSNSRALRNRQGGWCLDGSVSQGVRLNTCDGGTYQQWIITTGSRAIQNVHSGLCLDGSISQGVGLNECHGSTYQQWSW